ncbi:MAG: LamG domain-containing protein, partial [Clostridia bacterium]|nr:LamG domain-containing protein [Clostridia bacterium]
MQRLLSLLVLGLVLSATAGTVSYWSFEDDTLVPGGTFGVFEQGDKPVYSEEVNSAQIWDGGTYSLVRERNGRSVYFGPSPVTNLAPSGGEIVFPGEAASLSQPTLTVECFVRVEQQVRRFALLASKRRVDGSTWSLAISPEGVVTARFDTQQGDSRAGFNRTVSSGVKVDDGAWHHVAMSYDLASRNLFLYVDGLLARRTSQPNGPITYGPGVVTTRIGEGFKGLVAEVRFWSVATLPTDIATSMYSTVSPSAANLVAYYRLTDGGVTAQDSYRSSYADWKNSWRNAGTLEG